MAKLRTATMLILVFTTFLATHVHDCQAQQRRKIVGGEKFVWDPVLKQWVFHQGTATIKANRGTNGLPNNGVYGGAQRPSEGTSAPANSSSARRQIVGGEKWVWDPVSRQWVYHQGTKTIKANRGSNAIPENSYFGGGQRLGGSKSTVTNSTAVRRKAVGGKIYEWDARLKRWMPSRSAKTAKTKKGTNALPRNAKTAPPQRLITNPYVSK